MGPSRREEAQPVDAGEPRRHPRPPLPGPYLPPRDDWERRLCEVLADCLALESVGIGDDLADLGVDSLHAARLAARLSAAIGRSVPIRALVQHRTVTLLAEALRSADSGTPRPAALPAAARSQSLSVAPGLRLASRPLLELFAAGELEGVDAAAIGSLPSALAASTGWREERILAAGCQGQPVLASVLETHLGRIASVLLPRFDVEVYEDPEELLRLLVAALETASHLGARQVSLTGILASACDYGRALATRVAGRSDLPAITTGHATTAAAVVLNLVRMVEESGRSLAHERLCVLGLGSVGMASLRLLLRCQAHPAGIVLCDLFARRDRLEAARRELRERLGFAGEAEVAAVGSALPSEVYDSTLVLGATNVANVLEVGRLKPGTLLVDDSAPHCFDTRAAVERFEACGDILFSEGGLLQAPAAIGKLTHLPAELPAHLHWDVMAHNDPFSLFGCMLSALLGARDETLQPTLGQVALADCLDHYEALQELGFGAADPRCDDYVPAAALREAFRRRFGRESGAGQLAGAARISG
jgi:predicted amino acid dehydrogenase